MNKKGIITSLLLIVFVPCVLSAALYEYGRNTGDTLVTTVNDGFKEVIFTQGFPFYDYLFKKTYINENGLVSMITPVNKAEWKNVLPISGDLDNNKDGKTEPRGADARILIAPFWANVDVTEGGTIYYRQLTTYNDTESVLKKATEKIRSCFVSYFGFTANHGLLVTWDEVSFFGFDQTTSTNPKNTFQLLLVSDGRKSFALFLYKEINWNAGTEEASGGDPEFGKSKKGATIGFNIGDPYNPLSHPRSGKDADNQLKLTQFNNCPSLSQGVYLYKIDPIELVEAGCKTDADLTVFPTVGSMYGGEEIFLAGPCWDSQAEIVCRFKYNNDIIQEVTGKRITEEKAVCVPQPFFLSGELTISVSSDNGVTFTLMQNYYVANLDRLQSSGVTRINTHWENWDRAGLDLVVRWDKEEFDSNTNISIATLVYREDGLEGPRWEEVFTIIDNTTNDGEHTFMGAARSNVNEDNAFGVIRIRSTDDTDGRTLWSDVHTLGYLLNEEYQDNPSSWSRQMCDNWVSDDKKLPNFVDKLISCPCTLQQAIVDTGRFQPDSNCNMYDGSNCPMHTGAKHCVISVAASKGSHSGTHCCYNGKHDLMYAGDSHQGSSADRSHVLGVEPYQETGMVPTLSHWNHDLMPFYFCCKWGGDCNNYLDLRPTAGCVEYNSPKAAAIFGDPHFVTFDGVDYTFNGKGEYTMVQESGFGFEFQGRTEQAACATCHGNNTNNATVLSAIVMQETGSDVIQVELNTITVLRFIRKIEGSIEVVDFRGQQWLDFNGVSVIVVESENENIYKATITFWNSGIGVNVTANGQTIAVSVTFPPSMKGNTDVKGLLGNWDSNASNDLTNRNGEKLEHGKASPQQILDFGISWEILESKFYYEFGGHDDFQDNTFDPLFDAPDRSTLPDDLVQDMDTLCKTSAQCVYDVSVTRDITVGKYTIDAQAIHSRACEYTTPVISCPYLSTPINGTKKHKSKTQQNYLQGAVVVFTCNEGLEIKNAAERTCQSNGKWSGTGETTCVAPGESVAPEASTNVIGIAVGVVIAIIAVIIIVAIVIFLHLRKKKEQDAEAGTKPKQKKDYKEVNMSDVKEDENAPGEEDELNLYESPSAKKADDE